MQLRELRCEREVFNYATIAEGDAVIMQIPKNEIHTYISINPRNAEQMMTELANQMALMVKHIEMLNGELTLPLVK